MSETLLPQVVAMIPYGGNAEGKNLQIYLSNSPEMKNSNKSPAVGGGIFDSTRLSDQLMVSK